MAVDATAPAGATSPDIEPQGPIKEEDAQIFVASQWQLIWWRFRKHKVAMGSAIIVILIYLVAIFAEFLAPFPKSAYEATYTFAPPQRLNLLQRTDEGLTFNPHVNGYSVEIDPVALRRTFVVDPEIVIPVSFFVRGAPYEMWFGLIKSDIHLLGPVNDGDPMYLFGADRLGRDQFSRIIFGTRVSMSIGLVGVALSLVWGFYWAASPATTAAPSITSFSASSSFCARFRLFHSGWAWQQPCRRPGRRSRPILPSQFCSPSSAGRGWRVWCVASSSHCARKTL